MKNKLLLCILLLLITACLFSLSWNKHHDTISTIPQKDTQVFYHTNQLDYQVYGTDYWAVYFDFSQWFPDDTTTVFNAQSVSLYSDSPVSLCKLFVFDTLDDQPHTLLDSTAYFNLQPGWNNIPLPQTFTMKKIWISLKLNTSENGPYLCTSQGSGSHSYYMHYQETTGEIENAYYNFSNIGLKAEILMTLHGSFNDHKIDLQLNNFAFSGPAYPDTKVKPMFSVTNNSDTQIRNVSLHLSAETPGLIYEIQDSLFITDILEPFQTIEYDTTNIYTINFPATPTQITFNALIKSDSDSTDPDFNNSCDLIVNSFSEPKNKTIIEQFIRSYELISNQLYSVNISNFTNDHTFILTYYPDFNDTLNTMASYLRNKEYKNFGIPNTLINGKHKISGFSSEYLPMMQERMEKTSHEFSFLNIYHYALEQQESNLNISFNVSNPHTKLSTIYLENCLINVFLVEHYSFFGNHTFSLSNYLTSESNPIDLTELELGTEFEISLSIPFDQIDLKHTQDINGNYILITVEDENNEILQSYIQEISGINYTHSQPPANTNDPISIYPNPTRSNKSITIKSQNSDFIEKVELFNIKGQKMKTFINQTKNSNLSLEMNNLPTGVYLCKITHRNSRNQSSQSIKSLLHIK